MAGFPPGSAHGQSRLPALTLIGSERLSNSFFETPRLRLRSSGKLLTGLLFPKKHATLHRTQVRDCCNMPQPGRLADGSNRIALSQPDLERCQTIRCQKPNRPRGKAPI